MKITLAKLLYFLSKLRRDLEAEIEKRGTFAITVAASDTPQKLKDRADYICDGVDDQEEIISALSESDCVVLLPGTFYITSSIDISNKTLMGSGKSTILKIPDGYDTSFSILKSTDHGYVTNIYFNGNKRNVAAVPFYGITLTGKRNLISNCWFTEFTQYAVYINGGSYNIVDSINVNYRSDEGVDIRNAKWNVVANSVFTADSAYNGPGDGVHLYSSNYNVIIGNVCRYNYMYGIFLDQASNNAIVGNVIISPQYAGIGSSYGANYNIVQGNYIESSGDYAGIYLCGGNNLIEGNTCKNTIPDGIRINGNYNVVSNNICRGYSGYGIKVLGGTGNLIEGNDLYSTTGSGSISDGGTDTCFGAGNRMMDGTWKVIP